MKKTICDYCKKAIIWPESEETTVTASGSDHSSFDLHGGCWAKVIQFIQYKEEEKKK